MSAALVVFRICKVLAGYIFLWIAEIGNIRFMLSDIYFLHRWDYILVPGISLVAAVLASRWVERKFLGKSRRAGVVTGLALTAIALFPVDVRFGSKPVMVSPLEIAIHHHYSIETVEAIIDRYPRLINRSDRPWDHYRPLVDAALDTRTNLVELLIRKGANVDIAVQKLQQLNAESAVKLVLDCNNNHNKIGPANGSQPFHSETNRTSSAAGSRR